MPQSPRVGTWRTTPPARRSEAPFLPAPGGGRTEQERSQVSRFDDFQKHCTRCRKGRPCGKSHLYVIELDEEIWEQRKKFRDVNRHFEPGTGKLMLYVGMTAHAPRCRQSQHQTSRPTWRCYCGLRDLENEREIRHQTSRMIRDFTSGHLKASLFKGRNPVEPEDAEIEEAKLARHLRECGHAVWAGHHDTPRRGR